MEEGKGEERKPLMVAEVVSNIIRGIPARQESGLGDIYQCYNLESG